MRQRLLLWKRDVLPNDAWYITSILKSARQLCSQSPEFLQSTNCHADSSEASADSSARVCNIIYRCVARQHSDDIIPSVPQILRRAQKLLRQGTVIQDLTTEAEFHKRLGFGIMKGQMTEH